MRGKELEKLIEKSEFKDEYLELVERWEKLLYDKLEAVGNEEYEKCIGIIEEANKVYKRIITIEECIKKWS